MAEVRKTQGVAQGDRLLSACPGCPACHRKSCLQPSTPGAGGHLLQTLRHRNNSENVSGTTFVSKFENLDIVDKFRGKYPLIRIYT